MYFYNLKMLPVIISLFVISEGAKIPIEFIMKSPIDLDKFQPTFETTNIPPLSSIQPRYFLYNILQVDSNRAIPLVHFPYGKPDGSYVTSSFNYYDTPLYTYQIHYRPLFPNIPSMIPSYIPQQQPITTSTTTTERPFIDNDDNIEKLDEKVEPNFEMNSNNEEESMHNDDSVVIDAIN